MERYHQTNRKAGLIWYTDGSKTNKGTGAGVYVHGTRQKFSFSLGQYTTVFQATVYAIKACMVVNLDRNYRNRNLYILSDCQSAIKALSNYQLTSKRVWDCHWSLTRLAEHNRTQLIWRYEGTNHNKMAS
jgi:hypothetical protein